MFVTRSRFGFLLLAGLILGAFGAPLGWHEAEEVDPELSAGYFEGDMDVDFTRNGILDTTQHWPNATVRYRIGEGFDAGQVGYIELGMRLIERASCVRFVPADEDTVAFVLFTVSTSGCSSNVGYRGKQQVINLLPAALDTGCFRLGTIQHEMLHTLGFHHQQSSSDRDDYVKIVEENILEGKEHNFKKYEADQVGDFDASYDYGSILHYSALAFANGKEPTIIALHPDGQSQMGQRRAMSSTDIIRLNTMYKCPLQV